MKRSLLVIIMVALTGFTYAQQLPQYTQYMLNDYVLNPAVTGANSQFEGKANNRYQWVGITDAPRTYILTLNGPLSGLNMGVGGIVYADITGPTRRSGFNLSYAYHLKLGEKMKLSFGVNGGLVQFAIDGTKIVSKETGDFVLSNARQSVIVPDATVGLRLHTEKFYIGISAPQILQNRLEFFDNSTNSLSYLARHYYAMAGYKFKVGESVVVEPSVLVQTVSPVPVSVMGGLRAIYKDKLWVGGVYRMNDSFSGLVGLQFNDVMFGYSYDFTTSGLRRYSSGTHELMLGLKFGKPKIPAPSIQ